MEAVGEALCKWQENLFLNSPTAMQDFGEGIKHHAQTVTLER